MHCIVSGRVQGVWFRASARDVARHLGLTGWVRNLPDGRVELVACGAPPQLEALREWLHAGPDLARVETVECDEVAPQPFERFEIR
jgi:acylphosphatase